MCGRYYVDDDTAREIEKLVRQVDERLKETKAGDICPTQMAPILVEEQGKLTCKWQRWGMLMPGEKDNAGKILINARAETAVERPIFRENLKTHRIVIPAAGFYEWNRAKEKNRFYRKEDKLLFMAGLYGHYEDGERFAILTTAANESMQPVHDRMPLILDRSEVAAWLKDGDNTKLFLGKIPPLLERSTEYEQMSLF